MIVPSAPQPAPIIEREPTAASAFGAAIEAAQCLENLQSVKEEQLTLDDVENQAEND